MREGGVWEQTHVLFPHGGKELSLLGLCDKHILSHVTNQRLCFISELHQASAVNQANISLWQCWLPLLGNSPSNGKSLNTCLLKQLPQSHSRKPWTAEGDQLAGLCPLTRVFKSSLCQNLIYGASQFFYEVKPDQHHQMAVSLRTGSELPAFSPCPASHALLEHLVNYQKTSR